MYTCCSPAARCTERSAALQIGTLERLGERGQVDVGQADRVALARRLAARREPEDALHPSQALLEARWVDSERDSEPAGFGSRILHGVSSTGQLWCGRTEAAWSKVNTAVEEVEPQLGLALGVIGRS